MALSVWKERFIVAQGRVVSWNIFINIFVVMEVHQYLEQQSNYKLGRAVSCRLPTAVAQVRIQVRSYEICGGRAGLRAFPATHSTDCSTLIIIHLPGLVQ
jgi:hypothetical protein